MDFETARRLFKKYNFGDCSAFGTKSEILLQWPLRLISVAAERLYT
jgi:hypothetical protein